MSSFGGSAPTMLGISFAQTAIGTALVVLRGFAASTHTGKMRWDFFWVVFSTVLGWVCQGLLVQATRYGVGNHLVDVKIPDLWQGLKLTWTGLMVGLAAVTFAKISIIALLLTVTTQVQPRRRVLLWTVGLIVPVVNTAQMAISLTQCTPSEKLWYKLMPGNCDRADLANNFGNFQGAIAVSSDLFLALYPTTIVWDLKISYRAKIAFCVLMAGGLLPAAAGLMRTIYIPRLYVSKDPTYELSPFLTWAITEVWLIIILGSVPPLRPLFERTFKRAKAATRRAGDSEPATSRSYSHGGAFVQTIGSKPGDGLSKNSELMLTVMDNREEGTY
ncbi:hypothetical protein K461DRAFT_273721 [Myriangium duriaei CBS 260.36]|uniref:Rhodopsin domain-containing protein n=1 Tax=Myriangium duriaei CBS 260.36 TaxID=1168546 RepID=A0A9P4MLP7_9PEZI|nr:hypothetical protein K461DRAFT_273721 [Myriangium duriaei CBS 260.36]